MVKVYLETYGCTMNQADSDIIRGVISRKFELVDSVDDADVVIINSCGVIEFTERKIIKRALELRKKGKKIIIAGCLPRISTKSVEEVSDGMVSPDNIHKIDWVIENVLEGTKVKLISKNYIDKAKLHKIKCRLNENAIAIVSISEGCVGRCAFCATRFARGRLRSFDLNDIVEEVKSCIEMGFKEIQLTSQDTGAYGLDKGRFMLPDLLNAISEIEGEFRVRVGMMNPHHAVKMLDDLIEAFKSEKIYKFIHIPVQSGDNKILEDMRRGHTVEDFIEVVSAFRKSFDDVLISTDIIVGYPTESEESFWKSYELIKTVEPDIVNITRFSMRRFTPASKLKDIPDWIKKERSRILTKLVKEIGFKKHQQFLNKKYRVLITRKGKNDTLLSRTDSYRPVIVRKGNIGEFIDVKITGYSFNYLVGTPISI
ncbi:MAG TPA: tRNA (N(6)-L-threonylcarbamoyladenosine(37)-C(2))-methylthiotransferase [Archaeoglobus profundus]|nr:tRNA (N(6)-L-threonylcarbamoyladenosine(37)-C(2))-methylthiotransferase [Archaeoglobus profundus]